MRKGESLGETLVFVCFLSLDFLPDITNYNYCVEHRKKYKKKYNRKINRRVLVFWLLSNICLPGI